MHGVEQAMQLQEMAPRTFQCACLAWASRSNASDKRAWSSATDALRTWADRSMLVS
jgi:hypothetical protein